MVRDHALRLLDGLTDAWEAAYGPLSDVEDDLSSTRRFFDPVATGRRLRAAIAEVRMPEAGVPLPPPLAEQLPRGRWLVTPDGRIAIELLVEALRGAEDPVTIDQVGVIAGERRLLQLYRTWGRHRLDQVVRLQEGDERPLQIGPIGLGLLLLVNRCTAEDRALPAGPDDPRRRMIDEAIFPAVRAFETRLRPVNGSARGKAERRVDEKESLAGGWMPPELYRRFPDAVIEPRKGEPQLLWVRPDGQKRFLVSLAAELQRRKDLHPDSIGEAFDALVDMLRGEGPTLAAHGLLHERSGDTARLRSTLIEMVMRMSLV